MEWEWERERETTHNERKISIIYCSRPVGFDKLSLDAAGKGTLGGSEEKGEQQPKPRYIIIYKDLLFIWYAATIIRQLPACRSYLFLSLSPRFAVRCGAVQYQMLRRREIGGGGGGCKAKRNKQTKKPISVMTTTTTTASTDVNVELPSLNYDLVVRGRHRRRRVVVSG